MNMRLISIDQNGSPILADVYQGQCQLLTNWPASVQEVAARWNQLKSQRADVATVIPVPAKLNAPIVGMEKVICIGTNYADHAIEMGGEPPTLPVVFNKFPSAINAPGGDVRLPVISQQVDFEAELVVVIGKSGKNISRAAAMDHVFGYCCGNDITARDWQKGKPGGQWLLGKTFDSFAPIGPMIVTADEIPNPHQLDIELRLNGLTMQSSNTSQLIFPIHYLIWHISKFATLKVGDLIFTGTPPGVGAGRKPPVFLQPGDQLEVEIESLGVLRNQMVADCSAARMDHKLRVSTADVLNKIEAKTQSVTCRTNT